MSAKTSDVLDALLKSPTLRSRAEALLPPIGAEKPKTSGIIDVLLQAKTMTQIAKDLGVSYQAVQQWVRQGYVPLGRVTEIEARYGVPRERLLHPRYLESMAQPQFSNEA